MPRSKVYPDPNGATQIGAALSVVRLGAGATNVAINYNPANGDVDSGPLETTMLVLSAGARTNLAAIIAELDAAYKVAKGYT